MHTHQLIAHFADRVDLPIDVNEVLTCLSSNGVNGEIEFIGVELDTEVLQGQMRKFYGHDGVYADPILYVNIYFHLGHDLAWQRMICCKELIHLIDPPSAYTASPDDVRALAEKIGLPPEMQDPASDSFATNVDRVAEFRAAAILLPWAARELLMPAYRRGEIKNEDIARLADIPRRYVGLVMSPGWEAVHALLVQDVPAVESNMTENITAAPSP